jgi:hypothetical protein
MIRKFSWIFAIAIAAIQPFTTKAQVCTPDQNLTTPGFLPATLPDGQVNSAYSVGITIKVFKDTEIVQSGQTVLATIDSMLLISILGLPPGLGYECLNSGCSFVPSTLSCVNIKGTPTQSGLFPLKIPVKVYAKVFGAIPITQPDTLRNFAINVKGGTASMVDLNQNGLDLSIFPNPATKAVWVNSPTLPKITSLSGVELNVPISKEGNIYRIDISRIPTGLYFIANRHQVTKLFIE